MKIDITLNQVQANINPSGGILWTCNYDKSQKFTIVVSPTEQDEVGQTVGLTQTLLTSTRTATYETGGELNITPDAGLPCLDGDETMIPWYNKECKGKVLGEVGSEVTFTLEDSPSTNVPSQAKDTNGQTKNITRLNVSESFLVTIYNNIDSTKIKQWKWSYSYNLTPKNGSIYAKPIVDMQNETEMLEQEEILNIIVVGPVATAGSKETWTPEGWGRLD